MGQPRERAVPGPRRAAGWSPRERRPRGRRAALAAVLLALAAVAGCTGGGGGAAAALSAVEYPPGERRAAPAVTGELLEGGRYDISAARGKVVVVNFWGSWCGPCRAEIGALEDTYRATRAAGVEFLGINVRDSRDHARTFQDGRVTYPSIFDPASRTALAFDVPPNGIPTTVVLDRAGRVAVMIRRDVTRGQLEPIVNRVAAEPRPS